MSNPDPVYDPAPDVLEDPEVGNLWNREPAMVRAFVGSLIALFVSFGLQLSGEQVGAIMSVVTIGLGLWTRRNVSPA